MSQKAEQFLALKLDVRAENAQKAWTEGAPLDVLNEGARSNYDRINKVLLLVAAYFNQIDVDLLPAMNWNEAVQRLANIESFGKQFKTSKNAGLVNNANAEIDALLRFVIIVPNFANDKDCFDAIKDSANQLSRNVGDLLQTLAGRKQELENATSDLTHNLKELSDRYATEEQRISSQVQTHQDQFARAQDKRQTEYAAVKEKQQKEFIDAQNSRQREAEKSQKESADTFAKMLDKFKADADALMAKMNAVKTATEKIYGLVGKEAVVGSQKAYADKAKKFAHWLTAGAIVLMLAVAVIVVWPLLVSFASKGGVSSVNWIALACRIPVTAVLLIPAWYLANEAKKQRTKENRYRELEIKLAAITPYFAEIDSKKGQELPEMEKVKIELAKNLLSIREEKEDNNVVFSPDVLEFAKILVSAVKK